MMRCVSLHQPWASLLVTRQPCYTPSGKRSTCVLHGMVKTVETRSWPCPPKFIGQRIAFHATAKRPPINSDLVVGDYTVAYHGDHHNHGWGLYRTGPEAQGWETVVRDLPFGAIVGSGVIAASLPIVGMADCSDHDEHACHQVGGGLLHHRDIGAPTSETDISGQLPYGDYTPGRFAWIITDAAPTTERCPWCWGVGDVDEHDSVRGHLCPFCAGDGRCDPIPANGRQRIWEWTPTTAEAKP